ncbi:MAG: esterase [Rubrivivax sp.]
MEIAFEWQPELPPGHPPPQLLLLLHGAGGRGVDMVPLAEALHDAFPQAAIVVPDAPHRADGASDDRRQWFGIPSLDDAARIEHVAQALPPLAEWVRATQRRTRAAAAATALVGFSQGAILALELASRHDGLCGRVLAFAGRYACLPVAPPRETTLHLFHGDDDAVIPVAHAREALQHLGAVGGDATLDVAAGVGHVLHPALIQQALFRLRNHIPYRTWQAALGAAPARARAPLPHAAREAASDGDDGGVDRC